VSVARPAAYRDVLQVSPERIASMSDDELNALMRVLLCAQAYRCGADVAQVRVNTEDKAKDDGCDGWSPGPGTADVWLGSRETCWQFKAGSAGEPRRLAGEIGKPVPTRTLSGGGGFVVITSGSTNGRKGEQDRLATLTAEAAAAQLTTEAIQVIGSEGLAIWCNQHPAVAARFAGRPDGLWQLDDWTNLDVHQVTWQSTPAIDQEIIARRRDLDFKDGEVWHLHIQGPPGVGKSRLALELCRDAEWKSTVVYIQQAADFRLTELIDSAVSDGAARLLVVADEVQQQQLEALRDSIGRGQGRIRLITIGQARTPDPRRIPALSVHPLEPGRMSKVVSGWYPALPPEHVHFVTRFADGYVRLARLAADAVMRTPTIDVRGLLDQDHIRSFLDGMLGQGDRSALYVVAALTSVGWSEDRLIEGEAIARHLGLDWNVVRRQVDDFQRRLGIAPRGGRLRYISPAPLAIHLAVEAWTTYADRMKTLPDALPNEEAQEAYYERLQTIASHPQARRFTREQLSSFFRLEDYLDDRAARRWSMLASADPVLATRNLAEALTPSSTGARSSLAGRARREVVWGLVRLAWKPAAFRDATVALALLAEAENETWGNNASAEFVNRFKVFLGGTAVPYLRRLDVLDDLVSFGRPSITRLVIRALAEIGNRHETRMGGEPVAGEAPEPEWRPTTGREHFDCAVAALTRLAAIARSAEVALEADLVKAVSDLAMLLRDGPVRPSVADAIEAIRDAYPHSREPLRRAVAEVLAGERKYWRELNESDLGAIEALHHRLEDQSLGARLRQFVGPSEWDETGPDLGGLASELLGDRDTLALEWSWLTSGDAGEAWRFGEALALADSSGELARVLPELKGTGRDYRALCGYVGKRRQLVGDEWFEDWVGARMAGGARAIPLLVETTWRCGATESTARMLARAVREHGVDEQAAGKLGLGRWHEGMSQETLRDMLSALSERGHSATTIAVLGHRLKSHPEELESWREIAQGLVLRSDLIRSRNMTSYYWKAVALRLLPRDAADIAAAILREQADRRSGSWFVQYSEARTVLGECVNADPVAVWRNLVSYLRSPGEAYAFAIGFPLSILEGIPVPEVQAWVSAEPKQRAVILATLAPKNLATDETLASWLLAEYGDDEDVERVFFSSFVSGSWWGSASVHWGQLAAVVDEVATRTALPRLRRWAERAGEQLRGMAERDREREDEEGIRGR
jgi:hypothetical protein